MGANSGVATLDSNGINAQAPKAHTHDDRYYTEAEADARFATKGELGSAGYGDMLKSVYDTNGDGTVDKAASVPWDGITGKPSTYTPSSHTHDDRYYTETEADSRFAPASHTHNYKKGGPLTWDDLKS